VESLHDAFAIKFFLIFLVGIDGLVGVVNVGVVNVGVVHVGVVRVGVDG